MCGLTGVLAFHPRGVATAALLIDMRDTMAHRGPDGAGLWQSEDGRVGLAHRRLAVIDTSAAAAQPMASADGRFHIAFNGEIYNHAELRRELVALGHRTWRTDHSDTEVILEAFAHWGIDCLRRFRGMFAFALWDAAEHELWLARDRVGVKPLYYAIEAHGIAFASEIKALLVDRRRPRAIDEESLFHFLSFLATPAPRTLFAGVRKLAAGTWLRVRPDGSVDERRWWDPFDELRRTSPNGDRAYHELLLETLRRSVRYRKVADVPLGVFLSGGVDSSSNLALFSEGEVRPVRTFSIGYAGSTEVADELPYARIMAARVGADHHERILDQKDLLDFLPRMIRLQDEPIADPVCVPVYYLAKLAREAGVVVCQLGEGADELFCGYPGWRAMLRLGRLNRLPVPAAAKGVGVRLLEAVGRGDNASTEVLRRACADRPLFWGGAEAFTETQKRKLLSRRLRHRFAERSSWEVIEPIHRRFIAAAPEHSDLNWMSYLDLNLRLPELLLMRVDKMTMGASIEARVPFLDQDVIGLALGMPEEVRIRNGNLKHVLKEAVRGLVPEEILNRPKQGFAVPVRTWYLDKLGRETRNVLEPFCRETDLLDWEEVDALLAAGDGAKTWYLLNLALWWREFIAA